MTFSGDGSLGELLESLQTLEPEPWSLPAPAPAPHSATRAPYTAAAASPTVAAPRAASNPLGGGSAAQASVVPSVGRVDRDDAARMEDEVAGPVRPARHARWTTSELSSSQAGVPYKPPVDIEVDRVCRNHEWPVVSNWDCLSRGVQYPREKEDGCSPNSRERRPHDERANC